MSTEMEKVRNVSGQIEDLVRKNFADKNATIRYQNNLIKEKDDRIAGLESSLKQMKIQMQIRENIVVKLMSCERQKLKYLEEKCKILESSADENQNVIAEIEEAIKQKEESEEKEKVSDENEKNEIVKEVEQEYTDVAEDAEDESFDQSNEANTLEGTNSKSEDDVVAGLLDSDEEDNGDDNIKGNKSVMNDFDDIEIEVNIEPTVMPNNSPFSKRKHEPIDNEPIDNAEESPKRKVRKVKKAGLKSNGSFENSSIINEDEKKWDIEEITKKINVNGAEEFHVQWKDWQDSKGNWKDGDCSWEKRTKLEEDGIDIEGVYDSILIVSTKRTCCRRKVSTSLARTDGRKRSTCLCPGCQLPNCGECKYCEDMPQFGGPFTKRKRCQQRKCLLK